MADRPEKERRWVVRLLTACVLMAAALFWGAGTSRGEARVFDFKDPKGVNAIAIRLDSLLEPIVGLATGVSGRVTFDPAKPEATTGTITVASSSIAMCHPLMTKTLHSPDWLDVEKYPSVVFAIRRVDAVKKTGEAECELRVTGDMTIKAATREQQVVLTVTHLPGKYAERNHKGAGDLLVLRCGFSVDRRQFDIRPDIPPISVAYEIQLGVGIVGAYATE